MSVLWSKSKSKVASWSLKERFRSHQKSLALIGCCEIIYRAISVVIFFFLVWMRRLAAGMGVGVRSMPTGSFGWGGLMLLDLNPPMNPKETSLMTHPNASMKMYNINKAESINLEKWSSCYNCLLLLKSWVDKSMISLHKLKSFLYSGFSRSSDNSKWKLKIFFRQKIYLLLSLFKKASWLLIGANMLDCNIIVSSNSIHIFRLTFRSIHLGKI